MNITNDLVTEYLNKFYEPLTPELLKLREAAEKDRIPVILRETESFLKVFLRIVRPKKILEIGCAVGYSAMFFAEACGGKVFTIEKDRNMYDIAVENVKTLGYSDRVIPISGDGREAFNLLSDESNVPFDLVFIDGAKSHYRAFFEACRVLCHKDTIIVSDNVLLKGRTASDIYDPTGKYKTNIKNMREYTEFLCNDPKLETTVIACGDGLAITRFM